MCRRIPSSSVAIIPTWVMFLPPYTTSILWPLDQELTGNVKLLFYKSIYEDLRRKMDSQTELLQISNISDSEQEASEGEGRCEDSATSSSAVNYELPDVTMQQI